MKPNFTLSLSFEGIRLLHRAAGGWRIVGEVAVDSEDLAGELAVLRRTAAGLEPGGVRAKLLIPNDQIKYLTLDTPNLTDSARKDAAREALEGATPYDVDELAYDISVDGAQTHVAAVARETLTEAEAFANEHRFHPVSFVAQPATGTFSGEPFFGLTDSAPDLLDADETVDRDDSAIVVLSGQTATEAAQAAAKPATPPQEPAEVKVSKPADLTKDDSAGDEEKETQPSQVPQPVSAQKVEKAAEPVPEADTPATAKAAPEKKAPETPEPTAASKGDTAETNAAGPQPKQEALPKAAPKAAPAPQTPAAFASRRSVPAAPSITVQSSAPAPSVGGASRAATVAGVAASTAAAPRPDSSSLTPPPPIATDKPALLGFLSRRKPRETTSSAARATRTDGLAAVSGVAVPRSQSEADQMTIFGARKTATVGGKPRYLGLLLTAALLIFLAGVAAWASVFLDDGISLSRLFSNRDTTAVASAPPAEETVTTPVQAPTSEEPSEESEIESDAVVAALDPALSDEDDAVLDALREPEQAQPRDLTEQELQAKYATDGIWAIAPETPTAPAMVSLDDLYVTSIDPVSTSNDAVALPELASFGDDSFNMAFASPAPAGTDFALDDRGFVEPSETGAMNPDGILVFAGRPAVIPPEDVNRAQVVEAVQGAEQEDDPLLEFRPRVRPDGLVENNERSELGGLTRTELARVRPALRPQSVQEAAAAAATPAPEVTVAAAAAGASLAAVVNTPAPAATINNATDYAVEASIRPDTRPNNFARIVKRAERAAPAAPTQVASAASVAPRTVQPSIPSSASVSRQATVKNAIKMRDINLIGVYGKPSNRRALIRLGNGRYQKVAVGDRLDGGRVSAIGDSELRYQRRGRDVVLRIPSG